MHGIILEEALIRGEKATVNIESTIIEDNICNGVQISSLYVKNSLKRIIQTTPLSLDLTSCQLLSNKNIGLSVRQPSLTLTLVDCDFMNNLYCDMDLPEKFVSDEIWMQKIFADNRIEQRDFIQQNMSNMSSIPHSSVQSQIDIEPEIKIEVQKQQ